MKILYVTTIGGTMHFFKSFVSKLIADGHKVDIACNEKMRQVNDLFYELGCKVYNISCTRSPFENGNLKAIKELKAIVKENGYDIVHCHTPIASACTRIACRKARKNGTKVIYTAHGFHFYKGAPKKNWILFYPIEKICAKWTDLLITINKEDFARAKSKLKTKFIEYVPGVGIDVKKFANAEADRDAKRGEIGVPADCVLLLSVGELNKNKNQETVIRALAELKDKRIHYALAGRGSNAKYLTELAESLGVSDKVHLIGHRADIPQLCKTADIFVHPSFREGLPVSIMEAMAAGLPIIGSRIRGVSDLLGGDNNVTLCAPNNVKEWVNAISSFVNSTELRSKIGNLNSEKAKELEVENINETMMDLYNRVCGNDV